MRVCLYTHPAFLEPALGLTQALSSRCELHLLVEMAPGAWQSATFDHRPQAVAAGIVAGDPVLGPLVPEGVRALWQGAASFDLVVHPVARSIHPSTVAIGRQVVRFLRDREIEVLHVDDVDVTPRLALVAPLLRGLPIVASVHDPTPHSGEHDWRKALSRRLVHRRARSLVVHNEAQRDAFAARHERHGRHVDVVHLQPYDLLTHWPAPDPQHDRTVLFAGRISPYKGLDVLYAAAPAIARAVPGVRIVVAGRPVDGYDPPSPPRLVDGEIEVHLHHVPNRELAALYGAATVVVCPYRDATQSGVVLTAQGLGRAVVASSVGGLPEYVTDGDDGLLVPPCDPDALAAAVVAVLRDGALRARLEAGARRRAAADGWSGAADALLAIYQRAIDRGRPGG